MVTRPKRCTAVEESSEPLGLKDTTQQKEPEKRLPTTACKPGSTRIGAGHAAPLILNLEAIKTLVAALEVFWFVLPLLMFLLADFFLLKTLIDFPKLQNDKGQVQSSPDTASKSRSGNNPSTSKRN